MIEAIFSRTSREAAIDGAYQYDTGQRLRLSGLPSPEEMTETDDMLTGELPAVQVQYGYVGDSQTDMRLAQWDEDRWAWLVDIPDAYLTQHEAVHVYVYVSYGEDAGGGRNKTMYEGVFTPISRPAPSTTVTAEQIERWNTLEAEVELALVNAQTAAENAQSQIELAENAAQNAEDAAEAAYEAAHTAQKAADRIGAVDARWEAMKVSAITPAATGSAGAVLGEDAIRLTLPRGYAGAKGETGDTGPADITLAFSNGVLTITPQ